METPPPYTPPPQQTHYSFGVNDKPGKITAIAVLTLVSGIVNIMAALGFTLAIVLGTLGIGLLCAPITLLPIALGVFEIIYAIKLLSTPPQPTHPNQVIAILEIVTILYGNIISVAVGVLALVFYAEPDVKAYFAWINGQAV